jgi:hypothetical protein
MKPLSISRLKLFSIAIGLFSVVCVLSLIGVPTPSRAQAQGQLDAARARWASNHPAHYRLVVERKSLLTCTQEVEVQDEQIIAKTEQNCRYFPPAPTVSTLFDEIQTELLRWSPDITGCPLGTTNRYVWMTMVSYDSQLGYPLSARGHFENLCANSLFAQLFAPGTGPGIMNRLPMNSTVKSLTPLP